MGFFFPLRQNIKMPNSIKNVIPKLHGFSGSLMNSRCFLLTALVSGGSVLGHTGLLWNNQISATGEVPLMK